MSTADWILYLLLFSGLVFAIVSRRRGQISRRHAQQHIRQGAIVIDVRSPEEFNSGHLSQAFNMPLDEIESLLPAKIKDKNRVILLHCQTGLRSKKALSALAQRGYKNVFTLGSYERAFRIVSGRHL